jgi:site-specific recombinase XerD
MSKPPNIFKDESNYLFTNKAVRSFDSLPKTKGMIERFLKHGHRSSLQFSELTKLVYISSFDDFFFFVNKEFDKITTEDIENYKENLLERKKPNGQAFGSHTIKSKLATIKGFYRYLRDVKLVKENPVITKFNGQEEKNKFLEKMREILTREEVKRLLDISNGHPLDNCILTLLYNLGMRVGELCKLRMRDIDLKRGVISIRGKGNRDRNISELNADIINSLELWFIFSGKDRPKDDALLIRKSGRPIKSEYVRNMIRKRCRQIGIDRNITPHSFRRTFATHASEDGMNAQEISIILGHTNIIMTSKYVQYAQMKTNYREKWKGIHKV